MKKIVVVLLVIMGISGCSFEENTAEFQVEFVPIESIEFPEYMASGTTYDLKIFYRKPTNCHYFDGIYTETTQTSSLLAVQTLVIKNATCNSEEEEPLEEEIYTFTCPPYDVSTSGTSYTFEIYKGDDASGDMVFEKVEVPIAQ
ncbi:hypothetical protein [Flavobacterium litorale]|uniref:Lipoprotein n=1 Tax=Flavobacterium litorale TaxID=2856519 RepID=A0ABX8V8F9_9FLAO|nr:hypothetical protein [Flavobacterium litorale]QYJ69106.1 hypothetical protein K1I41_04245 [Flavobacterium litorale]